MKNSSLSANNQSSAFWDNPKAILFQLLIKECFSGKQNHSEIYSYTTPPDEDGYWCPRVFDGFACWDETPATAVAFQPCPYIVHGFDTTRFAYKICTENGTWYTRPGKSTPWTNYTLCVDMDDFEFRRLVGNIYIVGYVISTMFMTMSLIIFSYFRSLQCTRTRIHIHLFVAFIISNISWIIWYRLIVNDVNIIENNAYWCQIFHVTNQYWMITTYGWMFCESLHLQIALVVVFVKEDVAMRWCLFLGWGFPLIIVSIYAAVRYQIPGATERCWVDETQATYIILVPVICSLVTSAVFLLNVVRILITKLRSGTQVTAAGKTARAALILIPLFGLQFFLIPFRPPQHSQGEQSFQVFSAIIISLQGACVSLLFCFTNHDVLIAIRAHFIKAMHDREAMLMTGVTVGESTAQTRENAV